MIFELCVQQGLCVHMWSIVVSFTGNFLYFCGGTAVVKVDNLTYLAHPHGCLHAEYTVTHVACYMETID